MASEMKVEIIHKETIRPSSPTPHHLRYSNFSLFDQFAPEVYPPVVLFYTSTSITDHLSSSIAERSNLLKSSLSETLTRFYPFAGIIELEASRICCNDNGAAFIEAHVNCPISKISDNSDPAMLKQLIATDIESTLASTEYLLLVQANFFECGGIAIGVSISHKLSDCNTLSRFLKSWAAIACGSNLVVPPTDQYGSAASLFPPLDFSNSPPSSTELVKVESRVTTRRFKFDGSKIAYLKSRAASDIVPRPSRVEAVSAFIWKCVMEASRVRLGFARPSVWCQAADVRKLLGQPSAAHLIGNVVGVCTAKTEDQAHDRADLKSLVAALRNGIKKIKVDYANAAAVEICENYKEFGELLKRDDSDNYICSSWCKFPFYDTNFGWGKPTWVLTRTSMEFKNLIVLIDTSDGAGIQASLTLEELDMAIVESKTELLAYASSNPVSKL